MSVKIQAIELGKIKIVQTEVIPRGNIETYMSLTDEEADELTRLLETRASMKCLQSWHTVTPINTDSVQKNEIRIITGKQEIIIKNVGV